MWNTLEKILEIASLIVIHCVTEAEFPNTLRFYNYYRNVVKELKKASEELNQTYFVLFSQLVRQLYELVEHQSYITGIVNDLRTPFVSIKTVRL